MGPGYKPGHHIPPGELDRIKGRCLAIYHKELKAALEASHKGEWAAVSVDGTYGLGRTSGEAIRELQKRSGNASGYLIRIGSV